MIQTSAGNYTQSLGNRREMINFSGIHSSASSGTFPFSFPHPADWCLFCLELTNRAIPQNLHQVLCSRCSHSLSNLTSSHDFSSTISVWTARSILGQVSLPREVFPKHLINQNSLPSTPPLAIYDFLTPYPALFLFRALVIVWKFSICFTVYLTRWIVSS